MIHWVSLPRINEHHDVAQCIAHLVAVQSIVNSLCSVLFPLLLPMKSYGEQV